MKGSHLVISHLVKMNLANDKETFVQLWLRLEHTRRLLEAQHKRFCIRNVLKNWFGAKCNEDFIWEVCFQASTGERTFTGWDELPPPMQYPRRNREFLRALVSVKLNIGIRKVNLPALDAAYSIAFPDSTPINVNKKKTPPLRREWGFAPLCGARATFSGSSEDPSRPLGGTSC